MFYDTERDATMGADIASLCRSFLPNNPRLAETIHTVARETYKVRFVPKTLIRLLINRAMDEIRRSGHEFAREPEFKQKMEEHARMLHSRYRGEISRMNSGNVKRG
jgi:hypothetical protein